MPTLRFFVQLLRTSVRASLALRGAFLLRVAFMALNNLIFFVFWWLLFQRVPSVRGYDLADMATLFGVSAAGFGLANTLGGGVHQLGRMIDEGELDTLLTQPKPTLPYAVCMRCNAAAVGDFLSGTAMLIASGHVSLSRLPLIALAIASSAVMFTASAVLIFSSAFWLGRNDGACRQMLDTLITFSLYPDTLFGGAVRLLLFTALPAAFVGHVPAKLVREPSLTNVALLLTAIVFYSLLAAFVFKRGLSRYNSGSRFGVMG
ncbi:MAG: ABC-2 family transporter protein [Polyangiaceae bacterium]